MFLSFILLFWRFYFDKIHSGKYFRQIQVLLSHKKSNNNWFLFKCVLFVTFSFFKFATISLFKKKFNSTMGFILSYLAIALFIGFSSFSYGVGSVQNFEIKNWVVLFLTSLAAAFLFKK